MAKTKNIFKRGIITILGMMGIALGAKVTFQPLYSDVRFQPVDKLHAGCTNSADILFAPQDQKITKFTLVLYYNPDTLQILRIVPSENNGIVSSKIEYNKIILDVENPTFTTNNPVTSFFQLYFKSDSVGQETLSLGTGSTASTANKSYPLNDKFILDFAKVAECEPDIVPPSINLIYPKETQERISLDQYFMFDIKDIGKGVDKNSVTIQFNGDQYFYGSDNLKRNGNYLTFYPGKWIPIDTHIDLKILVTDKQSYGGANKAQSIYTFQSATGMLFIKDINPMIFRQIAQEAQKVAASARECAVLADFYSKSPLFYQKDITAIIQKVGCNLASVNSGILLERDTTLAPTNTQQKQYIHLSIFASLGWILFFIAFTLKMHYLLAYKQHKKINTLLQKKIME